MPREKQYSTPTDKEGKERITRIAQSKKITTTVITGYLYEKLEKNDVLLAELETRMEKTVEGDKIKMPREKRYYAHTTKEGKERITRISEISGKSFTVINGYIFEKCEEFDMMRLGWEARMKKAEGLERQLKSDAVMKPSIPARVRAPARNPVYSRNKTPIKLKLNEKPHYQTAIRYALDNSYRWTKYNIQEMKTYLEEKELNLNPVNIEVVTRKEVFVRADILMREYQDRPDKAKELYEILELEWRKPACSFWIERRLYLWEVSHAHAGLKNEYLTTKEWYEKMELYFPQSLDPEADDVITNRNDLERSGIIAELEYKIKDALKIDDEMETLYHTTEIHTPLDTFHIQNLIRENPSHPYSDLLKQKIRYR